MQELSTASPPRALAAATSGTTTHVPKLQASAHDEALHRTRDIAGAATLGWTRGTDWSRRSNEMLRERP
eukprot:CAMPEP_0175697430 /NCGR_PEP_ID=MMETSP0097-20121207/33455_1 /TAXON_ID=311494 /ORGANISM="Alexandrium monilatum, Strain CCMP3105" /LENGTH=68 /DNA_ID=CAMNT_0017004603 /DNA_START=93 /DNA_END=295 /DNA_ORIENTATION=-